MVVPTAKVGRSSLVNRRPDVKKEHWLVCVRVGFVKIDLFSSSTAARRLTEVTITVTLVVRTLKFGRIFPEKEESEEDSHRFSKTEIKR